MPALPLHEAGPYVAGAYVVFAVVLMTYVTIMMRHVDRVRRDLRTLRDEIAEREDD